MRQMAHRQPLFKGARSWLGGLALALALTLSIASQAFAAQGDITTVAGNGIPGYSGDGGPATAAQLNTPAGVVFGPLGNLFVADYSAHTVRKVNTGGTISTLAGTGVAGYSGDNGPAGSARLDQPGDVAIDTAGNVYIADFDNSRVRRVAADGTITTFAGTGVSGLSGDNGPATAARLANPVGLDLDGAGDLYVADFGVTPFAVTPGGTISRVAGTGTQGYSGDNGPATAARESSPADVAVDERATC